MSFGAGLALIAMWIVIGTVVHRELDAAEGEREYNMLRIILFIVIGAIVTGTVS